MRLSPFLSSKQAIKDIDLLFNAQLVLLSARCAQSVCARMCQPAHGSHRKCNHFLVGQLVSHDPSLVCCRSSCGARKTWWGPCKLGRGWRTPTCTVSPRYPSTALVRLSLLQQLTLLHCNNYSAEVFLNASSRDIITAMYSKHAMVHRACQWRAGRQEQSLRQDGWQSTKGHGHGQQGCRPCQTSAARQ